MENNYKSLIAPCGMNCAICLAYLRDRKPCPGCREDDTNKSNMCVTCIIKNCDHIINSESGFCYDCDKYPCKRLKQLDKRYTTKYNMSMLENLQSIKSIGLQKFAENEDKRWKCNSCNGTVCVHRGYCLTCNQN